MTPLVLFSLVQPVGPCCELALGRAREAASQYTSGVHPIVWAAIGGGTIAVVALIVGLASLPGSNQDTEPKPVIAVAKEPVELVEDKAGATTPRWQDSPLVEEPAAVAPTILSAEELYARVSPSVVTVVANDERGRPAATGSGFFIQAELLNAHYPDWKFECDNQMAKAMVNIEKTPTEAGYVLTNFHVVKAAADADIVLGNGNKGRAWGIVTEDENADLALLKVTVPSKQSIKGVPIASADPRIGSTVYAMGSPRGLSATLSQGIVSGIRELPEIAAGRWLQTTAPISPGSSGGPILLAGWHCCRRCDPHQPKRPELKLCDSGIKNPSVTGRRFAERDLGEGVSIAAHELSAITEFIAKSEIPPRVTKETVSLLVHAVLERDERAKLCRGHCQSGSCRDLGSR